MAYVPGADVDVLGLVDVKLTLGCGTLRRSGSDKGRVKFAGNGRLLFRSSLDQGKTVRRHVDRGRGRFVHWVGVATTEVEDMMIERKRATVTELLGITARWV